MATRMKDIATALDLSIVTVSKVLNKNDANISEATRQRVLECAKRLDYRTNMAAKGLVTGQSKMIGLIVPDLFHGFFGEVAAGMSDALTQQGYGLIIASSRDNEKLESQEIRQMLARSVDALVVASCSTDESVLQSANREAPVVLVDRRVGNRGDFWLVGSDDLQVGELATQHLVGIGRRRIAFVGAASFSPTNDRQTGYLAVLARVGLKPPSKGMVRLPQSEESNHVLGAQFMRQLLKLRPRPDAVFCYNDTTAWGATLAILEAGLRIPEDIAVVGCGNSVHNDFFRVPLTSVDQNSAHMGQESANLALRAIRERSQKAAHAPIAVLLRPTLVVRESTLRDPCLKDHAMPTRRRSYPERPQKRTSGQTAT
jgi:LacI family transcriptional regulator